MPTEMNVPLVAPRVEKRYDFSRFRINAGDVWPFVVVAGKARQAEVVGRSAAVVLSRNDMIDLEGKSVEGLRYLATLTTVAGPLPNQVLQGAFHALSVRLVFAVCALTAL